MDRQSPTTRIGGRGIPQGTKAESITPVRVWETLAVQQQRAVYKIMVRMCQQLLREERKNDEPR
jgi:hypothetical protein